MPRLVYFTVGHSPEYISLLELALQTVSREDTDVWVLCDESFSEKIRKIAGIRVIACRNSRSPEDASMRKLDIFDYDIQHYSKVLFLDTDILVHGSLEPIFERMTSPLHLYVATETTQQTSHMEPYWSLGNYTDADFQKFKEQEVYVFNAGCFGFVPSEIMRSHFDNLRHMIRTHRGSFFYEQSFMNVYFNRNGWTDRTVLTPETYVLFPRDMLYPGRIVHFCGSPGDGRGKYARMESYFRKMA